MKVTIRSQVKGLITREGNPSTLKDVKEMFAEDGINFANVDFIDRSTKASYRLDEAKIPNVEEILFMIVPNKNKSGNDDPSIEEIKAMSYMKIRSFGSKLNKERKAGIDLKGKTDDIIPRVIDFLTKPKEEVKEDNAEVTDNSAIYNEAKEVIAETINDSDASDETKEELNDMIIGVIGELQESATKQSVIEKEVIKEVKIAIDTYMGLTEEQIEAEANALKGRL